MKIVRRNADRRHIRSDPGETWMTFYPRGPAGTLDEGFGRVLMLNESILSPNRGEASNLEGKTDLITYIHKGALALAGPLRRPELITAGEFQCMTIGRIMRQRVTNTSTTDPAHFFRLFLRLLPDKPGDDYPKAVAQVRFTAAQRRNVLCAIASRDARNGSLHINTDARIYSSILDPGQHIVHELPHGRKAWLHIVYGKVSVNGVELAPGDGMGITDEPSVSLTVKDDAELLLVDMVSDFSPIHQSKVKNEPAKLDQYR